MEVRDIDPLAANQTGDVVGYLTIPNRVFEVGESALCDEIFVSPGVAKNLVSERLEHVRFCLVNHVLAAAQAIVAMDE